MYNHYLLLLYSNILEVHNTILFTIYIYMNIKNYMQEAMMALRYCVGLDKLSIKVK